VDLLIQNQKVLADRLPIDRTLAYLMHT
jgi:hypothetical protein